MSRALVITIVCLTVLAAGVGLLAWTIGGPGEMSVHGWVALALAVVVTAVLGGGLMGLAFYSSRRGYDEQQRGP